MCRRKVRIMRSKDKPELHVLFAVLYQVFELSFIKYKRFEFFTVELSLHFN